MQKILCFLLSVLVTGTDGVPIVGCLFKNPCTQVCTNQLVGVACSCNPGWSVDPHDRNNCLVNAAKCNAGYRPDPRNTLRCVDIDECQTSRPCDQSCRNYEGGYWCSCQLGYEVNAIDRNRCNAIQVCSSLIDIIFVIDSSGSLGAANNEIQLSFVSKLATHFQIGNSQARIGGILFSDTVEKLFDLNRYGTTNEVAEAIQRARYHNGGTKTNVVLDYIVDRKSFGDAAGGRSNARDIVVVFTDGQSRDPVLTAAASDRLKNQNVRIVTVGLGNAVDVQELNRVASSRSDVFLSPTFEDIAYIEQQLSQRVCNY